VDRLLNFRDAGDTKIADLISYNILHTCGATSVYRQEIRKDWLAGTGIGPHMAREDEKRIEEADI